jgi:hypothetical protein
MIYIGYYEHNQYSTDHALYLSFMSTENTETANTAKFEKKQKTANNTIPTKTCIYTTDILVTTSKENICT